MRIATSGWAAALLWAAALSAQTREIPFEGNVLRADRKADLVAGDHRVEVKRGKVVFRLTDSGAAPVEIATPSVTAHPYFVGEYEVEVKKSGESTITPVRGGEVKVSSPRGSEWVAPGRKLIARGPAANPEYKIVSAKTGWAWIRESLALLAQNMSVSGGGGSSGDDSSSSSSSERSRPTAAAPSSSGKGPDSFGHGDTRVETSPGRGK